MKKTDLLYYAILWAFLFVASPIAANTLIAYSGSYLLGTVVVLIVAAIWGYLGITKNSVFHGVLMALCMIMYFSGNFIFALTASPLLGTLTILSTGLSIMYIYHTKIHKGIKNVSN